jgi:hypothetical protein
LRMLNAFELVDNLNDFCHHFPVFILFLLFFAVFCSELSDFRLFLHSNVL